MAGSLRFRLPLLVVAVALPAVALTVWTGLERRSDTEDAVRARALQNARSVAHDYSHAIQSGQEFIRPVAAFLGLFPQSQLSGLTQPACAGFFSQFLGPEAQYVSIAIVETDGSLVCSSMSGGSPAGSPTPAFIAEAGESSSPVVSGLRLDEFSGKRVVTVAMAISGPTGDTTGIAYTSIDVQAIGSSHLIDSLPEGSFVTVTDSDGIIISRVPNADQFVGTSADNAAAFAEIREQREGTVEGDSLDGVSSLIAFTPVDFGSNNEAAFAIVGLPKSEAFGPAESALLRNLLILGGVTAAALLFGRIAAQPWIFGPVNRVSAAAARLGQGDLDARVGPDYPSGELGELSQAFDAMADRLQVREQQYQDLNTTLEERVRDRTRQLEAANQELESFSYSVSHDLRAPIRAIDGFSRILVEEHSDQLSDDAKRFLDLIMQSSVTMTDLIDDLLQFSRIGRASMERRDASVDGVVQDALDEVRPEIGDRSIDFQIGELGRAWIDPALLRRVYTNLLSNAIKFTRNEESPQIEVGKSQHDDVSVYYVRDNGAGFDMKYADKLFGVFQRLHHADEFEGTGVGLATAHRVVVRHGGEIWAESSPGEGAAFYFTVGPQEPAEGDDDGG